MMAVTTRSWPVGLGLTILIAAIVATGSRAGTDKAAASTALSDALTALPARSGLQLPRFRVRPEDAHRWHPSFKKGPGRRDFCNKMVYATDRGTALYTGANHNSPHRLNDVWEFELSLNTWRLILPPASDYYQLNALHQRKKKAQQAIKQGKNVEANRRFLDETYPKKVREWYACCGVENGYFQALDNGGPVNPRHTWDAITYDEKTKRLYWAVLDIGQNWMVKQWAKAVGQHADDKIDLLKPSSTMYIFDPKEGRWRRQLGEPPFPRMHGMGGTLVYLPDRDKTIWYIAATNRTPNDFGMWQYDAASNRWTELMSAAKVRHLVHKAKVAPGTELQAAYSPQHGKLVAVQKKRTFIYDVASNEWSRAADTPGFGHDAHGVFAYDSNADVFLLMSRDRYRSSKPWQMHAFDLKTNTWETIDVAGDRLPDDSKQPNWRKDKFAGYYDPGHNVFVLYNGRRANTWVYRHAATDAAKPG